MALWVPEGANSTRVLVAVRTVLWSVVRVAGRVISLIGLGQDADRQMRPTSEVH